MDQTELTDHLAYGLGEHGRLPIAGARMLAELIAGLMARVEELEPKDEDLRTSTRTTSAMLDAREHTDTGVLE